MAEYKLGYGADLIKTKTKIIHGQKVKVKIFSRPYLTINGERATKVLENNADKNSN